MTMTGRARIIIGVLGGAVLVLSIVLDTAGSPGWSTAALRLLGVFLVIFALGAGMLPPPHASTPIGSHLG
ncbi:hypothetical protein [Microbacterium oleivorans]|uniref:Uncharacterized protein n=1 Tax=Microbacterium oleivorans TaxID=273677 RepID=A0A177KBF1_9MICO|nr:hypothetical protein [Microbacterium oleivorans]OAH50397.1 hypothetical protein AYL44_08030 [Microbacterium oleivorans]